MRFLISAICVISVIGGSDICCTKNYPTYYQSGSQNNIVDWPAGEPGIVTVYVEPGTSDTSWQNNDNFFAVDFNVSGKLIGSARLPCVLHVPDSMSLSAHYSYKITADSGNSVNIWVQPTNGLHWKL